MNKSETERTRGSEGAARLVAVMKRLRGPDGCPWDREQTFASLRSYLIEETYEVVDALDAEDHVSLREELGDLLLQVVFLSQLASESDDFDFEDVAHGISDKLVRRHPHVFGSADERAADAAQAFQRWEQAKQNEKPAEASRFSGLPRHLPALAKSQRISEKAARVGFDWPDRDGVMRKVNEELQELGEAMASGDQSKINEELGDLLFATTSLARHCELDAEAALEAANRKFRRRFDAMESAVRHEGSELQSLSLEQLEDAWQRAKRSVANGG